MPDHARDERITIRCEKTATNPPRALPAPREATAAVPGRSPRSSIPDSWRNGIRPGEQQGGGGREAGEHRNQEGGAEHRHHMLGADADGAGPAQPFVGCDDEVGIGSRLYVLPYQRDHDEYLAWIAQFRGYRRGWLRGDVLAGLTVAAYLVPQVMAYATVAGLPPVVGLWAALVPLAVYAVLGSSRQLSIGPESTTALMTAVVLMPIAAGDPVRYAALAAALALLVGGLCLARGAGAASASWPICCPGRSWSATWPVSPSS